MDIWKNYKEKFSTHPLFRFIAPLHSSYKSISGLFGVISTFLGFLGDFVKPALNIGPYMILAGICGLIISLYLFRKKLKTENFDSLCRSKTSAFLIFSALSILFWIAISTYYFLTPPKGLLATVVPEIAELQERVLKIEKGISETRNHLEKIRINVEKLSKNPDIILDPQEPAEFYHNARIYELNGNGLAAIQDYENFLEREPNFSDPHQDYQTLALKVDSEKRIQSFYENLQKKYPKNSIVDLMANRLNKDRDSRLEKLIKLSKEYPKNGAIFYKLALEYLRPGYENLSLEEIEQAKNIFDQFKKLDEQNLVAPYYLDKEIMSELRWKVKDFEKRYDRYYKEIFENPFTIYYYFDPQLTRISIHPYNQTIQKVLYSIDDPQPFKRAEIITKSSRLTHKQELSFQLLGKLPLGRHTLYLKYFDAKEKESRVYRSNFEIPLIQATERVSPDYDLTQKNIRYQINWVSLDQKKYRYFYRVDSDSSFKEVSISKNGKEQDQIEIDLPPGSHQFYYYGISSETKTATYQIKVSP